MPTGSVMPYPRIQFFDTSGNPLASGTLETYEGGTSTPLATYSDVSLGVANPTTITLNAAGRPSVNGTEVAVFLSARAYKFILKNSAGTTIWTQDNVYALQPATSVNLEVDGTAGEALSANDLCYLSDGSGGKTAGRWYKADADNIYSAITPQLSFVTAAVSAGASGIFRTGGKMTGLSGLTAGTTYYVSATAGALTSTAPTYARIVGQADSTTTLIMAPNPGEAGILERTTRINAGTPYALTWPAADAAGYLRSDGAGALSLSPLVTVQTITTTGTANDLSVTGARHLLLRCNNASALTITGFAPTTTVQAGDIIDVVSVNAQVNFSHQTGSTATYQLLNNVTVGTTSLAAALGRARYIYDGTTTRWRLLNHEQGGWITPAFDGARFHLDGGATSWTVEAGDVQREAYWLKGRTLFLQFELVTTQVAGTPAYLAYTLPNSFTVASVRVKGFAQFNDNATSLAGYVDANGSGTTIVRIYKNTAANMTASSAMAVDVNTQLEIN